jgi:DNA primase
MKTESPPPVDVEALKSRVHLRTIIEADLGPPVKGRKWCCPFHDDRNPSLDLWGNGKRWVCRSCNKGGDVIAWVMARENLSFLDAARRLDGDQVRASQPKPEPKLARTKVIPWQDPEWQAELNRIIVEAERCLWGDEGRHALEWLQDRGLCDHTIRRFRLGFIPSAFNTRRLECLPGDQDGKPRSIWVRRGVTIPWIHPDSYYQPAINEPEPCWVGCNVRRLAENIGDPVDEPKYSALKGSVRGYGYPFTHSAPTVPTVVCEGEFDALVAWQEAGWIANPMTVGGASQEPMPESLDALQESPLWLLLFDHDRAGDKADHAWRARSTSKCRRLWLPHGKDLTEFHIAGGSVREWLAQELARFGWQPCGHPLS